MKAAAVDDNDDDEKKLQLLQSNVCNIGAIDIRIRDLIYLKFNRKFVDTNDRGSLRLAYVSI